MDLTKILEGVAQAASALVGTVPGAALGGVLANLGISIIAAFHKSPTVITDENGNPVDLPTLVLRVNDTLDKAIALANKGIEVADAELARPDDPAFLP